MSLVYLPHESTPAYKDALWSLAWGTKLVSGGADGVVRLHPSSLEEDPVVLPDLPLAVASLTATSDGKYALATSLDGTSAVVVVENGAFGARVETAREALEGGRVPAYKSALHPQGSAWAWAGRGSKVAIRSISDIASDDALRGDGGAVDTGKGRFGMSLAFSPDGSQVAVGMESGHVFVLDAETRSVVGSYAAHAMAVRALAWSPDSAWLYSGADDARIVLHDARAGEGSVAVMQGHRGWVLSAAASPDARLLASSAADSTVKLWDVAQRACVSTNNTDADVWALAWQREGEGALAPGKMFAVAGDDKKVGLYRAAGAA